MHDDRPTAIVVTTFGGDPTVGELAAAAQSGERPRKDFVLLAELLPGSVVIDVHYMRKHATRTARAVARLAGLPAGQIVEVFLRRRRFAHVLAWADRLGVPLALLLKLARSRADVVLISVLLTRGAKAFLVGRLRVHTHIRAIVVRSLQRNLLIKRFGVPAEKLVLERKDVDDRFFRPRHRRAARTPRVRRRLGGARLRDAIAGRGGPRRRRGGALGSIAMAENSEDLRHRMKELAPEGTPPNVRITNRSPRELRDLYLASSCVVVPVREAGFDAGVTATMEAMGCGRPVIVTRTEGLADLFTNGEHGIFVPPKDPGALRSALDRLLENPDEAERMGRAPRALVEERHRLDDRVAKLAATVLASPIRS